LIGLVGWLVCVSLGWVGWLVGLAGWVGWFRLVGTVGWLGLVGLLVVVKHPRIGVIYNTIRSLVTVVGRRT
jgi:hypothetical protein